MTINLYFNEQDKHILRSAIEAAERMTSGEIRVFIDRKCTGTVLDSAAAVFEKLQMHNTALRNGVLIYLAIESRQFAVIGDSGIHRHVGDEFWHTVRTEMQFHFMTGDFVAGLKKGILRIGEELKKHFPYIAGDKNELPDEIEYGFTDDLNS